MRLSSASASTNLGESVLNDGRCEQVANAEFGMGEYSGPDAGRADSWENYLADVPVLELPADRPRPSTLTQHMGVESCDLPENLVDGLRCLGRESAVDISVAGLAVFAVLLHRYSEQDKFVVATRCTAGEMVPVVADFSDRPTFRNLLQLLGDAISSGKTAGALPKNLAGRLGIEPDPSRHPIFQVAFSAEAEPSAPPSLFAGIPFEEAPATGLDLYLELAGDSELSLRLHYNEDLFERTTAVRMLNHLQQLFTSAIEDSNRSSAELAMLTNRELHEHLVERNNTAREFPQRCLHEHVELIAAKSPNAIAVAYGNQQLSYGEFNARANQMAHYLGKRGVGRNVRVGICLPRSLDFAIALLGVLKAGGTVVPLDPKYPGERLTLMMDDVGAPIVVTERSMLHGTVPAGTQVMYMSQERARIAAEPRSNPNVGSIPDDIAYVIYTSGSTGKPRGVLLPHAGLVNYTIAAVEMFGLGTSDRMLQFCSISFDAALEEIFSTWAAGATLVFLRDDVSLEPSELLAWVAEQRITVMDLPTAYWHEWVYALPSLTEKVPASLRLVIVGGEKASPQAYSTWHKLVGNQVRWINTYGPAEASIVATAYEPNLQPGDQAPIRLPIGRPVANARVYLLDPDLNPVPVGVPGELHIGGAGVARGYLNLPQLTAEKFVADPFSEEPSARMYKTGDLARYLPSGDIEFVGRRDNQVKIRGFRVEAGEIESVLAKHSGVNDVAVVLREDMTGSKRLVGYVVRSQQGMTSESELRQHVKKHLPEYMVPSEFVFLESMPLTPNGKINRRALPASTPNDLPSGAPTTTTSDPLQIQLLQVWEQLLGRKPIGVRDNFFELGGHSLLAARLMHRIKQVHGKSLPLSALLEAPTVEQLAAVLRDDFSKHWSSLVAMQPEGSKPPFFCVHGVGGNVVGFHELARRMKPDYPFYGLQSQGLDGKRPLHTRIEDMATSYLEEIRTVQARGPYYLGGFSFGGVVAYEMARQLLAKGEEVGLVVLLDTYASNPKPVKFTDLLSDPSQVKLGQLPTELRKKLRRTILAWRLPEVLKKVMRTNAHAVEQYRLEPYSGKAVLLRAGDSWRVSEDPYGKWSQLVGTLETFEIGGAHMDILREPQVGVLAERLKSCMDAAGANLGEPELLAGNIG